MESVVLVIHLILALAIIGLVLLQRSEGGGLGIGGGGGGIGGLASARGTANALTKMTAFCAAAFFITSLTLGVLAGGHSRQNVGVLENINTTEIGTEARDVAPPIGVTYTAPESIPAVPTDGEAVDNAVEGVIQGVEEGAEKTEDMIKDGVDSGKEILESVKDSVKDMAPTPNKTQEPSQDLNP